MRTKREGEQLTVFAEGRIDTMRAPTFAEEVEKSLDGVKTLVFDFSDVEYISSSGLRVLMKSVKAMKARGGEMRVTKVNKSVYDVFETIGFLGICEVEAE